MQSERLGPAARTHLDDNINDLWVSPISIWEVVLLLEKGRLRFPETVEQWVADLRKTSVKETPLTNEVAWEFRRFQLSYADPADRFLVATARVYDLTLVTADERLISARACKILANH